VTSQPPAARAASTSTLASAAARFANSFSVSWSMKYARTPRTCDGAAACSRRSPSSVSTALDPRRSDGHRRRSTSPARTKPSIRRVMPLG